MKRIVLPASSIEKHVWRDSGLPDVPEGSMITIRRRTMTLHALLPGAVRVGRWISRNLRGTAERRALDLWDAIYLTRYDEFRTRPVIRRVRALNQ